MRGNVSNWEGYLRKADETRIAAELMQTASLDASAKQAALRNACVSRFYFSALLWVLGRFFQSGAMTSDLARLSDRDLILKAKDSKSFGRDEKNKLWTLYCLHEAADLTDEDVRNDSVGRARNLVDDLFSQNSAP